MTIKSKKEQEPHVIYDEKGIPMMAIPKKRGMIATGNIIDPRSWRMVKRKS